MNRYSAIALVLLAAGPAHAAEKTVDRTFNVAPGGALIVDADDHALSWTLVNAEDAQAKLTAERVEPALGVRAWKERLLNCIADSCIRHSRRDPRHDNLARATWSRGASAGSRAARSGPRGGRRPPCGRRRRPARR